MEYIEIAEDIVSDTFLAATETWPIKGVPEHPEAWLYAVAKNKAKNYFKHTHVFDQKIAPELHHKFSNLHQEIEVDLSPKNIDDSQLAMIFALCTPSLPDESQVALSLNLLCGFGINEICEAYLTNREVIYKRIKRGKEKLKEQQIAITYPTVKQIEDRLDNVLKIIYLVFSEGYYSTSNNNVLRKDFCLEAMRLNSLLLATPHCNVPKVNALMALMCFHASRFEARMDNNGEMILYEDQDTSLWNRELIEKGTYFLGRSSRGDTLSTYHLEAGIAYWHTRKEDSPEKWQQIVELYNQLISIAYSPIAALNRAYVISKIKGPEEAIKEVEKLEILKKDHLYHTLLGTLYRSVDIKKARQSFEKALELAKTAADKKIILKNMQTL
ncbi:RNA polymerase sigma factor [Sinomicrobium sp. M5D2P17]